MAKRKRPRKNVSTVRMGATFRAEKDHVVVVFDLGEGVGTLGLRFESPNHMFEFFTSLTEAAAKVWPENEFIQYYMEADDE